MRNSQALKRVLELSDSESDEEVAIKSKSNQRKKCLKYIEKLEWIDDTVDELKTHSKGLSLNLKDGREILELVQPLHHLPVVQVFKSGL